MEDTLTQVETNQSIAQRMFYRAMQSISDCCLEIRHGGESRIFGDPAHPLRAEMHIHASRFFSRALFGGEIAIGEAFMDGDWSSPDLVALVRAGVRNMRQVDTANPLLTVATRTMNWLRHRNNNNTETGSKKNIAYHYDLGNDFYRLFLDESMAYSCAYHATAETSLEDAQRAKFDLICRKLDLKPSDHLLEIGTGWGGFAAYAATHYGCRITTTTISAQQHAVAEQRFTELAKSNSKITLLFEDYRKLTGAFDKIVSIEMFEAVGFKHYDEFFAACNRLLKPQGMMLLQTITMNERSFKGYLRQSDWIKKYIFPGAELASVAGILQSTARVGTLQMAHLEEIGEHYAVTLRCWRQRFLAKLADARAMGFEERFLRMWEYYLAYCEGGFLEHYIGDVQILMIKPAASLTHLVQL
ncbi:SAM-dependent methyltransferase [Granulicella arctica]|uniref:Cyclopropane-fatty-acyl-phospholipid synthase n=1 Tax=Granulicella arctica TaxID=940613 RepID=A0A7Y9PF23_9BACT|nr:cyclopropane-fatty-acyl-phospholipid synthase family protein [Granulicella arctica]NYF78617.1 cyclopropane-fatty-acyl-phospholipid synthase [Granulicella arctica]